jgi:uncharacterized protein (TIGR00290 family)
MTDVVLAWSGGKDSALALAALRADPGYRVVALLTTVTADYGRVSIHGVRRSVLQAQTAALGLPLIEAPIPPQADNPAYESSFALALQRARERSPELRHVAFGDLFLTDVRGYRETLLSALGWEGVFPLWGEDTAALAREFIRLGHRAIVTCVDTTGLAADFAGRQFDDGFLADLPPSVDPCGERGEFHTCVYGGPGFARALPLVAGERVRRDDRFEYCDVLLASATPPPTPRPRPRPRPG